MEILKLVIFILWAIAFIAWIVSFVLNLIYKDKTEIMSICVIIMLSLALVNVII
ncbi:Uncharacterised protein [Blautia hydrogenotrophica]|jgi:hypothetical protein|uniref:Uncharacterized protein n=1 Tax=Blautia hydrogenotrophica (strain DSM 10507 / JCM 14656 / S5a33) TaxID=476272 RepID=C0CR09_BLAHS|nr:hypothetical protein RUMHYD_03322 [Blautia hydrogenotrophica DSM 10507]WPX84214.1 hypothetical protein BLHYD_22240 [Blautia hydrogenotrophica DSM 10507]CUM77331.1 Uncharacterised protein [Blautia hydrogenotrophica]SCI35325.1 Uncharacterised protein [uncultured Blautia sp.]DAU19230.1 MAG TPA: hypothetical protein [Caudoviricetes sp.]